MVWPVVFAACYMLGALILAVFFLLDDIYFGWFSSNWQITGVLILPIYWFIYKRRVNLPKYSIPFLAVLLLFFVLVHAFLSAFFPDFAEHSWPEATARSIIALTSAVLTFVVFRHFNQRQRNDLRSDGSTT